MSSDNLDDFFKKRDKKKKNSAIKPKFQIEEIAKQLESAVVVEDTDAVAVDAPVITGSSSGIAPEPVLIPPAAPIDVLPAVAPISSHAPTHANHSSSGNKQHLDNFDEDWKPFESEDNKDYSGLRVNLLQNWKDDEYYEENEETEGTTEKKPSCPWSQRIAAAAKQEQDVTASKDADEDEGDKNNNKKMASKEDGEEAKSAGAPSKYVPPYLRASQQAAAPAAPTAAPAPAAAPTAYVPPALRKQQAAAAGGATTAPTDSAGFQTQTRRMNRNQPNINDICEFPSLGDITPQSSATGAETTVTKTDNKFEQPKRMGKTAETGNRNATIDLENKFNALSS